MVVAKRAELGGAMVVFIDRGIVAEVLSVFAVILVGPVGTIGS